LLDWVVPASFLLAWLVIQFLEYDGLLRSARFLRWAGFVAVAGLHIHLLAAGGISYPSILLPTWTIVSLGIAAVPITPGRLARIGALVLLAVLSSGVFVFVKTLYLPLIEREQILRSVRNNGQETALWRAARLVSTDVSGWIAVAQFYTDRVRAADRPAAHDYQSAIDVWNLVIGMDARRPANYQALGQLYWIAVEKRIDNSAVEKAAELFGRASQLYPNSASMRWEHGLALLLARSFCDGIAGESISRALAAGKSLQFQEMDLEHKVLLDPIIPREFQSSACIEFERALVLDQTPHPDRKLSNGQRQFALEVVGRMGQPTADR
jgi:hypothetical protein